MPCTLLYLDDSYLFDAQAQAVRVSEDEVGRFIEFDRTVFYPQGGGQPADTGVIEVEKKRLDVIQVKHADGEVRHYVDRDASFEGTDARLAVDGTRRIANAKAHTAGHLVANITEELIPALNAIKGHHFPDGAYVEFVGEMPSEDRSAIEHRINEALALAVAAGSSVTARLVSIAELNQLRVKPPPGIPMDRPLRVVAIGDRSPIPCGGTHVRSLKELATVRITRVKSKSGNIRVGYEWN
jgi:Ser-tRNA(Ala) deacylase AlaX